MKIYMISVLKNVPGKDDPIFLSKVFELSSYGYFQKNSVSEMLTMAAREIFKRTKLGERQSVTQDLWAINTYIRLDGLGIALVVDSEYPERVAFSLIGKLLEEVAKQNWIHNLEESNFYFDPLKKAIKEYQNPAEADKLTMIQKNLDQTMEIMHKTIDTVLERQVKLEDLVEQSNDLSYQSKLFYKSSKQSSCCVII